MTLTALTSPLLSPLRHGFYTRLGGASSGIFEGLNCGQGSSDQAEAVEINRSRVAEDMGGDLDRLVGVHQYHSADVVTVSEQHEIKPKADAIVTATRGLILSILTADCQPVLFADAKAGVIGAAHAGWRGVVDGVLENTVDAMVTLGAERSNISAVIGPCISQPNYEVGQEFLEEFMERDPANSRFFINGQAADKYLFDLPAFGLNALREAGVQNAEWIKACTYANADRFFSYRRTTHKGEADYGRLISTITLDVA
mgnify:FL=1